MRFVVTSGHDKSHSAIALCELLTRSGHVIESVFVVTPFNYKRIKSFIKQRGIRGIKEAFFKLLPYGRNIFSSNLQDKFFKDNDITHRSLKKWCKNNEAQFFAIKNLNSSESINTLKKIDPDAVIYSGGGILRSNFVNAAKKRIINNHSGPLPEIRGMNAVEWSILLGYEPSITIHLIDRGIDTGNILSRKNIFIEKTFSINDIRDISVITGVKEIIRLLNGLEDFDTLDVKPNHESLQGRQCFIMAPALRELLSLKIKNEAKS